MTAADHANTVRRWELSILVGPCPDEAAEELLLALQHKFGDHLGAACAMRAWDETDRAEAADRAKEQA